MDAILLDKKTVAGLLSVSLRTVETLIASGQLPVRRIGSRTLIARTALERFARQDHSIRPGNSETNRRDADHQD